jgi:non-reducing end alpha-L-arabinofuranosidase
MIQNKYIALFATGLTLACNGKVLVVSEDNDGGFGGSLTPDDGGGGDQGGEPSSKAPCDVFATHGHKCVSAHSTVRRLVSTYDGPLYQLCQGPNSTTPGPASCRGESTNIGATARGLANTAAHEAFCSTNAQNCFITMIYDQSGRGNHLEPAPPGSAKPTPAEPALAMALPTVIDGARAYGVLITPGQGYRAACDECTQNEPSPEMPVGDEPQTVYMVTSSEELVNGCCFNYGNASTTANNDGNGTIEAVNFSSGAIWGSGNGTGPWVMADLENGLFAGWENLSDANISTNKTIKHPFVTAMLVGDTYEKNDGRGRFALYGASALADDGSLTQLATMYDGVRPMKSGYVPMRKQGSLILGIGGDNSGGGGGRFYEGAIVTGAASKPTLKAIQASILAAQYGK